MPAPNLGYQVRRTYVVIWDTSGDDDFGQPSVSSTPEEILVRWVEIDKEVQDPKGRKVAVDVELTLNRDLLPGSAVWLGRLADLTGPGYDPPGDVRKVVTFEKVPDLKGRSYARTATLARSTNSLPTRT